MMSSSSSVSSSGTGVAASTSVATLMPSSPSGEICDESSNRFSLYLQRLAGHSDDDANGTLRDHCYARPWNWKPENIYVKPVKKIFCNKPVETKLERNNCDEPVDIERTDEDEPQTPHDLNRSRHQMEELQRLANFVRPEEEEEGDWEEKIEKILWLPVHHRIFSKVMRILTSERLARLAKSNCSTEPIFRRVSVDTAARRFRETLASTGWNPKTTQWLHNLLFDHLPREYLAIYLDILQTLRLKMPQLIDRMISVQPNINGKSGSITWETLGSLLKRSWDPTATSLNSHRPTKLPGNPILVIAPSGIATSTSSRQHKWITQLGNLGMVVNVHTHLGLPANRMTMMICMDQLVQATRAKIQDVRVDCPGRPIIMIGFNSGAALACQVAQMEHVTAVVCLGFPFMTVEGKRGTPDDTLMDMRCPVMFVIGENATLVTPNDLEDVREKMLVETSLVVVGTADDHLRISTAKKVSDGITQAIVDRCIMNEIGDFVASILLQPHPLPLRSVTMSSCENTRGSKKESRKRKNSTSSSVDSESNSPNVKKARPETPVTSSIVSSLTTAVPTVNAARTAPLVTSQSAMATGNTSTTTQTPGQKKKSKSSNYPKYNFPDNIVTSRNCAQQTTNSGNGGITLNIGSLASLAPIGPIKLTPTGVTPPLTPPASNALGLKGSISTRSPMTLAKIPKIVQKIPQLPVMKNKRDVSTTSKGLSKVISANYSPSGTEFKSLSVANTISANAVSQTKMTTSTSGSLTALLQSGKNVLGVVGTNSMMHNVATSSGNILLASNVNTGSISSMITTSPSSKVTVDIGTGIDGESGIDNSVETTLPTVKNRQPDRLASPTQSPMLLPISNKMPITILPISSQRTKATKPKTVPKITINSLHKSQCGIQASLPLKKSVDIDDDLGNILDIPIIFAKDGENLGIIEKDPEPVTRQIHAPSVIEPTEKPVKRLGSTTKVVLISNKQDKMKSANQSGQNFVRPALCNQIASASSHPVILHSRSQNQAPISVGTDWHGLPLQAAPRPNQSNIKYTKIILAKRNSDNSINNLRRPEQVILTKTPTKLTKNLHQERNEFKCVTQIPVTITSSNVHANDTFEIEDAIKTNIIERRFVSIPEIDLTSPVKNQAAEKNTSTVEPTDSETG